MQVACLISEMVSEDANIIFGTSVDESIGDEISVTLVATSLPQSGKEEPPAKIEVAPLQSAVPTSLYNVHHYGYDNGFHNGAHRNGAYKAR